MYTTARIILWCLLFFIVEECQAQCSQAPISLNQRIEQSTFVFTGIVTDIFYSWDQDRTNIYTFHTIEVRETYKGKTPSKIHLVTLGGQMDDLLAVVTPSLRLQEGVEGLFFTNLFEQTNFQDHYTQPLLQIYGNAQGFLKFDKNTSSYQDILQHNDSFSKQLQKLIDLGEKAKTTVAKSPSFASKTAGQVMPQITDIQPTIVNAANTDLIQIQGSGFGSFGSKSKVEFRNPDFFPPTFSFEAATNTHIISWRDTEIIVLVPARDLLSGSAGAGSGSIRVINDLGEFVESTQQLTVSYNRATVNLREVDLVDSNQEGGYTFVFGSNFENKTDAVAIFQAGLDNWRCASGVPFQLDLSKTGTNCPTQDGLNSISFDNSCQLPTGTLAQTTHWFNYCNNGDAYFLEMDIVFANSNRVNWNFDMTIASSTHQKDFASIVLHELGHAQGLEHVLNESAVMYPSLANATDIRNVDDFSVLCSETIISDSQMENNCGNTSPINPAILCPTIGSFRFKAKCFLEGAYTTDGVMRSQIKESGLLPINQPFNTPPWDYYGTDTHQLTSDMPIVDWVLIEILNNDLELVDQKAALLREDGQLVDINGELGILVDGVYTNTPYSFIIRHRNHLAVMSKESLKFPLEIAYDFTQPSNVRGDNQLTPLSDGNYALYAGDINADGVITVSDYNIYLNQSASINNYQVGDINLDKVVSITDLNLYQENISVLGISEIRY